MRQEALARKLRQIELNNLSITREMLYQEVAQGGYHWVQHVLPPPYFARIIPQPLRLLENIKKKLHYNQLLKVYLL
jgi:hypothetical protein